MLIEWLVAEMADEVLCAEAGERLKVPAVNEWMFAH